jgi:hypothetical protein
MWRRLKFGWMFPDLCEVWQPDAVRVRCAIGMLFLKHTGRVMLCKTNWV